MRNISEQYRTVTQNRYLGPGRVLEIDRAANRACVLPIDAPDQGQLWAHIALAGPPEIACGDTVLIIGEDSDSTYVAGVLARSEDTATVNRITLENGAYAQTSGTGEKQTLQVFSDKHALVFEYDAEQNKTRVNVESGDLEFIARNGDIAFKASQKICLRGHSVEVQSRSDVRLKIINALGRMLSGLTVQPRRMKLQSPELRVISRHGAFEIEETEYSGRTVHGQFSHVRLIAHRIETLAHNVIARAKNIYKTVEELTQLQTGRLRTLISSTYHMKSKNAYMNTDEDFKVKADKIHLG